MAELLFRPIGAGDLPFLAELYASTRTEELAHVGWSESQKAAFLEMQFRAQHADYMTNYPAASFELIVEDGVAIGRRYLDRRSAEWNLVDITLLPAHRGRGIGTRLMRDLLADADRAGVRVTIYVESFNRARRLYERLGFQAIGETGVYSLMARPAGALVSAGPVTA
jgi:ribosomal protein S18 acetylase RimI-like enzyme